MSKKLLLLGVLITAFNTGCSQSPTAPATPARLDDTTAYKAIYESDTPVLIESSTEESGPAKELAPIVAEVTEKHKGQFKLVRVDAAKTPQIRELFEISIDPTLVFVSKTQCKHGKKLEGLCEKAAVELFIEQSLIQCRE